MAGKLFKIFKWTMIVILILVTLFGIAVFLYIRQPQFGGSLTGNRVKTAESYANYKDGKFENIHPTPALTEGYGFFEVMWEFFFKKSPRRSPSAHIPSVKTDLKNLPADRDILVWFGHSSYFMQIDGKKILVDPVLSGSASPVPGINKAFKGSDRYTADDMPEIDYLFLSHDHYDHVDYETLTKLKPKIRKAICGLGVGAHLERWGYASGRILEKGWNETVELDEGFNAYALPARHFSGRGFSRNGTLWLAFLLQTPTMKIYMGGDSGYDTHFAEAGAKYGPIDLAILENGQYDKKWKYIHLQPHEVLQAAADLKAKRLFPVHSGKFVMANHPWDEPLTKLTSLNGKQGLPLVTPIIGEPVNLRDTTQKFKRWWEGVE